MDTLTTYEIAKRAGVSQTMVSRILGNRAKPTKLSHLRILEIAKQFNYQPNYFAASLKKGKTNTVGVTQFSGSDQYTFNHPYNTGIYTGLGKILGKHNYKLTFQVFNQESGPQEGLELVRTKSVDGLIIILYSSQIKPFKEKYLPALQEQNIPFVVIHSLKEKGDFPSVGLDAQYAGFIATEHLIKHGYQDIGCVMIQKKIPQYQQMVNGYYNALEHLSVPVNKERVFMVESYTTKAGYAWADSMVREGKKIPRALFVTDDAIAYGIMEKFKEAGIRVPADVAITGFGDYYGEQEKLHMISLGLTSVQQPAREKGEKAASLLLDIIQATRPNVKNHTIIVKPGLSLRTSCGCPK